MTDDIPDTGAVFTFGKSHFAENEPSHFFIKNDPIVAVSCGDEHSAVICQNGRVFVFGGNAWGQLGLGHKDEVSRPSCVKWLKPHRAMFVACGRAHTVFITDTNAIYTVGCNDEGQLGTGDMEHHSVPQYVEIDDPAPIKQVSAGSNHTAILTDDGRVFVCGSNTEGQLGLGEDTRASTSFSELKFMEKIDFVECGYYHTVFITSKGAVFVTGDNENNKLGISNPATTIYVPQVLPIDIAIKSACCGASHTFLLSMDEAKILAFGSNEKGQLGMPADVINVELPTEIDMEKMFDGFQLKLVACGAMHTAFVTDNGLLYTCGESRHNKLCLEETTDPNRNESDADPNQYSPMRVTAMNGFIVDNVACGGCHTLLTATKGSNSDFTNNDFSIVNEESRPVMPDLPPLQKIPTTMEPVEANEQNMDNLNGNEESGSIDSLEANVSGSHIVNINDLDNVHGSTHDIVDLVKDEIDSTINAGKAEVTGVVETVNTHMETAKDKISDAVDDLKSNIHDKAASAEEFVNKAAAPIPGMKKEVLGLPDKVAEIANSPPSKSPLLEELLQVPDIEMSPELSKHSDDGQKSENGQSENETIPCGSDKSSPQAGKTKTQAVMPIVRSDDHIEDQSEMEHNEGVVKEKGRFSRLFESIKDKENSCMSKGKVIEETIVENVHKGIDGTEEAVHKIEETVETEIRNQTNSRTCTIL